MQSWLGLLVVGCILPAAIAATILIYDSYERERADLERNMVSTARALMQAVDADLYGVQSTLEAFAASSSMVSGDLRAFYGEAQTVLRSQPGSNVVVHDPTGQQLLNTIRPYGTPLPRETDLAMINRVLETGKPVVSNLFRGPATGRMVLGQSAPVFVDGKIVRLVGMGMFSDRLGEVLRRQQIPSGWVVSILDRVGTIGARTEDEERFVGTTASPDLLRRAASTKDGAYEFTAADGIPSFTAFCRSARSGWMIAITVPASNVTAHLQRALVTNVALALVLLLAGAMLAKHIAGRVTRALDALAAPALALGTGEAVVIPSSEIEEVNELGRALEKAGRLIDARAKERDAAERSERRMFAEKLAADEANRAKSEFLALMSHELRTPLNAIIGFAQLLEQPHFGALTAKQQEFVTQVLASGQHLLELINDVLDLSKIEAGKLDVAPERVELVPLMKSVLATLAQSAAPARIRLIHDDLGLGLPPVMTDRVRLAQVLINLGSNAIKYNREDGTVRISCTRIGDKVRIAVEDTGMGIPRERQAELFRPFSRLGAEQRAIEGTGVGLALSWRLMALMGGTIEFTSTPGEGSRFWIDVPLYRSPQPAADAAPAAPAPAATAKRRHRSGVSILYAEDNAANVGLVRNILATLPDARMIEARDGASAARLAQQHRPDIVILDVDLPDMNGYEVLLRLRRMPETARTPVLALSASALPHDLERGREAGFFRYLTKPLDMRTFLDAIDEALEQDVAKETA